MLQAVPLHKCSPAGALSKWRPGNAGNSHLRELLSRLNQSADPVFLWQAVWLLHKRPTFQHFY